tara:strand:- start:648 stop:1301 length:654 start_codon:yes stop_codon:yes gene_type:complete
MIMEMILFLVIVVMQNVAVFLDNLGVFFLTKNHQSTKLAGIFAKKNQIDFLSRGFLFLTPPLLGYLLTNNALDTLLKIFVFSSFITLIVTILQSKWLLKNLQYQFQLALTLNKVLIILVGLCIYAIYLYVPFYLNILAYFFKDQSLWLVQLSPALTVLTSMFVVYYMDPRIARFIDTKEINKTPSVIFEMIVMRITGRVLIVVIALLMYIQYASLAS